MRHAEISSNLRLPPSSSFEVHPLPLTTTLPLRRRVICYNICLALFTGLHLEGLNDGGAQDHFGCVGFFLVCGGKCDGYVHYDEGIKVKIFRNWSGR